MAMPARPAAEPYLRYRRGLLKRRLDALRRDRRQIAESRHPSRAIWRLSSEARQLDRQLRLLEQRGGPTEAAAERDVFAPLDTGGISGTITDADTSTVLTGIGVELYDSAGAWAGYVESDLTGLYIFSGLADGTYYARTINGNGYLDELYDDMPCVPTCSATDGDPIVEAGGGSATADFALTLGGSISGTVTDAATSNPLAGIYPEIYDATTGNYFGYGYTDATGSYTVEGLPAGTYTARTSNGEGYIDELYDDMPCPGGACDVTTGTPVVRRVRRLWSLRAQR
jgi:hypothetical protein